jgi:hypothetical protein
MSSSTGNVKLLPTALQTPLGSATAVDLGEKTPRGSGFKLGGNPEGQGTIHEHGHEKNQDRDGGDSDEEPSFGVAL